MEEVDAHFHIWELDKFCYPWPTEDCGALYRDFSVADYEASVTSGIKQGVFVQVLNSNVEEAEWVLDLAEKHPIIGGVVAGLDPTHEQLESQITRLSKRARFRGIRHILDMEAADFLGRDSVLRGLSTLQRAGFTYDALLRPHIGLSVLPEVARQVPNLKIVIDHIAKPYIKNGKIEGWKEDIAKAAASPNVFCKISGLVTEADVEKWKREDFLPYVKHVVSCFGASRLMFGSDWPVLTLGATYQQVYELHKSLLCDLLTEDEVQSIFSSTAKRFYSL